MNKPNAFGFVGAGVMMEVLRLLPDIQGVRELWLLVMGGVMMMIGGGVLVRDGWMWFAQHMIMPLTTFVVQRNAVARSEVREGRRVVI